MHMERVCKFYFRVHLIGAVRAGYCFLMSSAVSIDRLRQLVCVGFLQEVTTTVEYTPHLLTSPRHASE